MVKFDKSPPRSQMDNSYPYYITLYPYLQYTQHHMNTSKYKYIYNFFFSWKHSQTTWPQTDKVHPLCFRAFFSTNPGFEHGNSQLDFIWVQYVQSHILFRQRQRKNKAIKKEKNMNVMENDEECVQILRKRHTERNGQRKKEVCCRCYIL